ncbi:hypothetical protein DVK00_02770 [Haloarcula sp. Atlit-47R]|uniref:hypothetical protein n=1 Tax=Haloarcula sp. Atlit-47R TaxID=2282132 RepID=UPI000EF1DB0D|nr:hypothetical protein [Haloarcula sp. Atlit-47R]RLM47447.1 hypothetical protein DVK00_02770 [Haloarcula sp. Atlit-47R]
MIPVDLSDNEHVEQDEAHLIRVETWNGTTEYRFDEGVTFKPDADLADGRARLNTAKRAAIERVE